MNLIEIDKGVFVNPSEIEAIEDNGYWVHGSPSDVSYWNKDGSRIILKSGRKVYTKLPIKEVIEKLEGKNED
jgi:hypothetical protein